MKPLKFKSKFLKHIGLLLIVFGLVGCSKPAEHIEISPEQFHQSVDKVVEIMIHDIFSPPVASRIFAYPNVAAYEILAQKSTKFKTLNGKLNKFTAIPTVDTTLRSLIRKG